MEKSTKRAIRRHHTARLKKTRSRYLTMNWWDEDGQDKRLGILSQYPKKCSCWMCGNSRKWYNEITIAEHRHLDIMKDGLDEVLHDTEI